MSSSLKILRRYHYDALNRLDRLLNADFLEGTSTQRFYQGDHLVTEKEEHSQRTIIRHEAQPLAQQESMAGVTETRLLATDQAHSLLQTAEQQMAYTAYGHHPIESGLSRLIGFNGECPDPVTGHYPLGQGTRAFNPVLMRFNSPDELSPFGKGGINSYAYCGGDPINFFDPTGNVKSLIKEFSKLSTASTSTKVKDALRSTLPTPNTIRKIKPTTSGTTPTAKTLDSGLVELSNFPIPETAKLETGTLLSIADANARAVSLEFDNFRLTRGFQTVATPKQIRLLSNNRADSIVASPTDKKRLARNSKDIISQIKKLSVDHHKTKVANIRQPGSSSMLTN